MPHLELMMTKLVLLLQNGEVELQELALTAISSVAEAAKEHILPYYPKLIEMLKVMMQQVPHM